jgi:hypothetical protein
LVPFLARSVGFFPTFFPPEPGLTQSTVRRLPAPIHGTQFVAFLDQNGPNPLKDTVAAPPLKPTMDRTVVTKVLGKLVPLASGAEPKNDPVDR